jgi:hypothetical protein
VGGRVDAGKAHLDGAIFGFDESEEGGEGLVVGVETFAEVEPADLEVNSFVEDVSIDD